MKRRTQINFAIKTTRGKRAINQDSLVCTYNYNGDFIAICCDGIGSIAHSEVASKLICSMFAIDFEKTRKIEKPIIWVKETLAKILEKLKYIGLANNTPNISTTLALLIVADNKYYVFNIGDTRIYGITHDKKINQLTKDHNYYNFLVKKGVSNRTITANKSKWFALTRYIDGSNPAKAKLDYCYGDSKEFRYFLICTDGLYGFVDQDKIIKTVNKKFLPLVARSSILNKKAISNNSKDNVSNIIISCKAYGK